eukprot:Awhi_evm2s14818
MYKVVIVAQSLLLASAQTSMNDYYTDNAISTPILFRALNFASSAYCERTELVPAYNCLHCDIDDFVVTK